MLNWITYFFGSFFSHGKASEGAGRSIFNCILGYILAMAVLALGLFGGYMLSFDAIYQDDTFKQFAYSTFESLNITIADGKAQGDHIINSYTTDPDKQVNGYNLIVDLRDAKNMYAEFKDTCVDTDGKEVTYAEFLKLSADEQKNYTFNPTYTGALLDYASDENFEIYHSYLVKASTSGDPLYNETIAEEFKTLDEGEKGEDYRKQIYLLYVKAYYPSFNTMEYGAAAPTLDGYYESLRSADTDGKYLIILEDCCYASFDIRGTSAGFVGYYEDCDGLTFTSPTPENVDALLKTLYNSGGILYYLVYIVNLTQVFMPIMIVWFVGALLVSLFFKRKGIEMGMHYMPCLRVSGSFMLVSGALAGIAGFVLSFFFEQIQCYSMSVVAFFAVWIIRTIVFVVLECALQRELESEE